MSTEKPKNQPQEGLLIREKDEVKEPSMYKVLLHNDDYTTMDFVIKVLVEFFHKSIDQATKLMLAVHQQGKAVAGVYSRDMAETKVEQVTRLARQNQHPLKISMEKE